MTEVKQILVCKKSRNGQVMGTISDCEMRKLKSSQVSYVQISNFVGIFWGLGKLYIFENYMA